MDAIKPRFVFMLCFLCSMTPLASQKFHIGIKSGVSHPAIVFISGDTKIKTSNMNRKKVPIIGISGHYQFNRFLGLKAEAFFEERGWYSGSRFALDTNGFTVDGGRIDVYYSFITTPLLAEVGFGKKLRVYGSAGINPAWRVGGKYIMDDPSVNPNLWYHPYTKKPRLDFGFAYGGGLAYRHRRLLFQLEYRYFRSTSPVGMYIIEEISHHYGEMLSMNVGYQLRKKRAVAD